MDTTEVPNKNSFSTWCHHFVQTTLNSTISSQIRISLTDYVGTIKITDSF